MSYRNQEEMKYFGSDLNKFVHLKCSKAMSVINLDVVTYKRSLDEMRVMEYKHMNEKIPSSQKEILIMLAKKYDTYVIFGDPPDFDPTFIWYVTLDQNFQLTQKELIAFLNYELKLPIDSKRV